MEKWSPYILLLMGLVPCLWNHCWWTQWVDPMLAPPVFNGKIHYNWPFSIAMLNYQRVYCMYNVHINKSTIDYSIYSKASYKLTSSCEKVDLYVLKVLLFYLWGSTLYPAFANPPLLLQALWALSISTSHPMWHQAARGWGFHIWI